MKDTIKTAAVNGVISAVLTFALNAVIHSIAK